MDPERISFARARRLAGRLNLLPIFLFGFWSVPAKLFWLIVLGFVPVAQAVPPLGQALPTFLASFLAGLWVLLLPRAFHKPRGWEAAGHFYRRVGIERFRAIVANGDLVNRFVRARHRAYQVYGAELEKLVPKSIWNEKRHLAYLGWGFVAAGYAAMLGWPLWALWLAGSNIGANLYPLMLQRYSRARVLRLTRLAERQRGRDAGPLVGARARA